MMRGMLPVLCLALCPAAHAAVHAAIGADGRLYISGQSLRGGMLFNPRAPGIDGLQRPLVRDSSRVSATMARLVAQAGWTAGIDAELLHAVIEVESNYDAHAVSRAGAAGLMQLMPETSYRFGVRDRFDPAQNLRGGASYLGWLLERFEGNLELALAAYHAGERAVERAGHRIPPFAGTRRFVAQVLHRYAGLAEGRGRAVTPGEI